MKKLRDQPTPPIIAQHCWLVEWQLHKPSRLPPPLGHRLGVQALAGGREILRCWGRLRETIAYIAYPSPQLRQRRYRRTAHRTEKNIKKVIPNKVQAKIKRSRASASLYDTRTPIGTINKLPIDCGIPA